MVELVEKAIGATELKRGSSKSACLPVMAKIRTSKNKLSRRLEAANNGRTRATHIQYDRLSVSAYAGLQAADHFQCLDQSLSAGLSAQPGKFAPDQNVVAAAAEHQLAVFYFDRGDLARC